MSTTISPPLSPSAGRQVFPYLIYGKLVLVAFFWGGTFIAGRVLVQALPSLIAATGRFAVAGGLLLLVAWKLEGRLPRLNRSQVLVTLLLGFTGIFAYNLCFFSALTHLPASRTALFVALNPIMVALFLAGFFGEKLELQKWAGIAIAFCGAAVVITRGDVLGAFHDIGRSIGLGEVLMFGAVLSWTAYTIIGRFALQGLTPIAATTYATLWGLMLFGAVAIFTAPSLNASQITWNAFLSIAYLGAVGTVTAFIWYYEGIRAVGPSRSAIFINLVPLFGVVLASLFLSEPVLVSMIIGGALTIVGVTLTTYPNTRCE